MVTKYITKDTTEAVVAQVSRTRYVINEGVAVNVIGKDGFSNADHYDNDLFVNGSISAVSSGSHAAVHLFGGRDSVTVGETGFLHGSYGVVFESNVQSVTNRGIIEGHLHGVLAKGDNAVIDNYGTIRSDDDALDIRAENAHVTNFKGGSLTGINGGDYIEQGMTFENFGTIKQGNVAGWAVYMRSGDNTLINHGKIVGGLHFDDGKDFIDLREGSFKDFVAGGGGNDTYQISSKDAMVQEYDNEGFDTLKAWASYSLDQQQEIEKFQLKGSKNISAAGSESNNSIYGNSGNNKIWGMDGNDTLDGGKGNDKLNGGKGNDKLNGGADFDTFVFKTGFGHDKIMDFGLAGFEADMIDLSGHDGLNTIAEIKAHAHQSSSGNAVIDFGNGDQLTLAGIDYHDLKAGNFDFG